MMRERKLYDLLRRLDPQERKLFAEFLRSPLHAHRPKLADLVMLMEEMLFQKPDDEVTNETFYAALYPGKPFDSNNLNRLISVITTEFKSYMALLHYKKDKAAEMGNLVREYGYRRWDDILPKEIEETLSRLYNEIPEDENQHFHAMKVELELTRYVVENKVKNSTYIFQTYLDATDRLSTMITAKASFLARYNDKQTGSQHRIRIEGIIDSTDKTPKTPLIQLHMTAKRCCDEENDDLFINSYLPMLMNTTRREKKDGKDMPLPINPIDAEEQYSFALGYCVAKINQKQWEWVPTYIQIFEDALDKELILENGKLNYRTFLNYISLLLRFDYFEKAESHYAAFHTRLTENPDSAFSDYGYGTIHFSKKNWKECIRIFNRIKSHFPVSTDISTMLKLRVQLCISCYETGDLEGVIHEANAILAFAARHKSSSTILKSFRTFSKAILRLERLNSSRSSTLDKKISSFKEWVGQSGAFANRDWMIKKAEELASQ